MKDAEILFYRNRSQGEGSVFLGLRKAIGCKIETIINYICSVNTNAPFDV